VLSPTERAFVTELQAWKATGDRTQLLRALCRPFSGVPHDLAAACAKAELPFDALAEAANGERLAHSFAEREALRRFVERVSSIDEATDVAALFELRGALREQAADDSGHPFPLAPPVSLDEPLGVKAPQSRFSASALNAYAECPRKWYYRYVCNAVDDPPSPASTYGTAFHAALEDFHGEFPQPAHPLEEEMRTKIQGYVNWAFTRFREQFATAVEAELQRRRALRTAQRYIDWLLAQAQRAPFTVIGRETQVELDLDGFAFVGYIDRIDRDDETGAISIFDYKTGSIASSAAEYRESVRAFRDFQLPFYYWARTSAGDRVARLALIPLKDALLDVQPISLEVVETPAPAAGGNAASGLISVTDLERARARMIEICRLLTSATVTAFSVATDPAACTYCAYRNACSKRPTAERDRFGR
jgi:RecB family exonuclease